MHVPADIESQRANTLMVPTSPDAAQGVLRPPCSLTAPAAHAHVRVAECSSRIDPERR